MRHSALRLPSLIWRRNFRAVRCKTRMPSHRGNEIVSFRPRGSGGEQELKLERLVRGRMKQFVDADAALGQAFEVMLSEEIIDHLAVRLNAVRPEIVVHQIARFLQMLLD